MPRNDVSERWVLTIETDKQANFLKGKSQIGIKRFLGQAEGLPTSCFHKTRISDELPNGSQQEFRTFFTLILRQLSFNDNLMMWAVMSSASCHQKQVIHNTLLPVEKAAYGTNDASRRWWNILDKALCSCGLVPTRADRRCYVLYSTPTCKPFWNKKVLYTGTWYK